MNSADTDVEDETDRLYQLPLDEFIAGRNALAAKIKASGDKDGAARVKALARPSLAAWAVNQAFWTARGEFDALLASTQRLLSAQTEGAGGSTLREAMQERRQAQATVIRRAESLILAAGRGSSADTLRRVSDTLEALAAKTVVPEGIHLGRLVEDLQPPGFEAVAAATPRPPGSATTADKPAQPERPSGTDLQRRAEPPGEPADALDRARTALAEAERALERARREAREAAGTQSMAEKRAEGARGELAEATRRRDRAQERASRAAEDETAARLEAEQKATTRDAAEAQRDAALRAVRDLE